MRSDEKYKLLVRNLRKKQDEKIALRKIVDPVSRRNGSARDRVPSRSDSDKGRE